MTVPSDLSQQTYTGIVDGVPLNFNTKVENVEHIVVTYAGDTVATRGVDYSVALMPPDYASAQITPISGFAALSGGSINVSREVPIIQTLAIPTLATLASSRLEQGLDYNTFIGAMVRDYFDRALTYRRADPADSRGLLPASTERAGKFLAFDNTGRPMATAGTSGGVPVPPPYDPSVDGYARVSSFGTGITALKAALATNPRVELTAHEVYEFTAADLLQFTDEEVHIRGPLSRFKVAADNGRFIEVTGGWDDIQDVSAISFDGKSWTVTDGTKYAKGDIVKVYGETGLWHYLLNGAKVGEFLVVSSVVGNVVSFLQPPVYAKPKHSSDFIADFSKTITGVANNGAGLCRITFSGAHGMTAGEHFRAKNIVGTTEANGDNYIAAIPDTTHIDIPVPYINAYVSGGTGYRTFAYAPTQGVRIAKIRRSKFRLDIGAIEFPKNFVNTGELIHIIGRCAPEVRIGPVDYVDGRTLKFSSCYAFHGVIDNILTGEPGSGYGINASGSDFGSMSVKASGSIRHGVDGGSADPALAGPAGYGHAGFNTVYNSSNVGSTTAPFATHHGTYGWIFHDTKAVNADGNIALRGINHTSFDAVAIGCGGVFGSFKQYPGFTESYSDGFRAFNPLALDCPGTMVGVGSEGGGSMSIFGGYFERRVGVGAGTRLVECGSEFLMHGTRVRIGETIPNRVFLMHSASRSMELKDVVLDFTGSAAIPSRIIDDTPGSGAKIVADNVTVINDPGVDVAAFFRGMANPPAGSRLGPVAVSGTMTALVFGASWSDLRPLLTGLIRIAGVPYSDRTMLNLGLTESVTIAAGVIAITGNFIRVDTEGAGASDDLNTINGGRENDIIYIQAANAARTVVAKDGAGNLALTGDITLDAASDVLGLKRNSSGVWEQISFSDNGA